MERSNVKVSSWVFVYGLALTQQTQSDLRRNIFGWTEAAVISQSKHFCPQEGVCWVSDYGWNKLQKVIWREIHLLKVGDKSIWCIFIPDSFNPPLPLFSVVLLPSSAHSEATEEPRCAASFQSPPSCPYLRFSSSSSSSMFGWNSPDRTTGRKSLIS